MIKAYTNGQVLYMTKAEYYNRYLAYCKQIKADECNIMSYEELFS